MNPWKKTFVFAFIGQICSIIGFSFAFPFLPFFIEELGVTDSEMQAKWAGMIMSASGITFALLAPVWGIAADRFGRKAMVVRAMFGGTVIVMMMSFVQSVHQLLVCRLIQGMFTGTVSASVALVASVTPERRSGFTLGMMQTAVFLGMAVGPLVGGVVADYAGYRVSFRIGSSILLAGGLLVLFGTKEYFDPKAEEHKKSRQSFRQIITASGFLAAVFVLFSIRFSNTVSNPSFPLIVKDILGTSDRLNSVTGSIIFSVAVAGALSAALLGHFGDRWGHKRILIVCSGGAAVISLAHFFAYSLSYLLVVRTLFGLVIAGMIPAANVIIKNSIHDSNIGKGFGLAGSLSLTGFAVGPFLGGWIAGTYGLRVPFLITGAGQFCVLLTVLFFITPVNRRKI